MRLISRLLAICTVTLAAPLAAQNPTDSTEQDRSLQMALAGTVLLNGFYTDHAIQQQDASWLVLPRSPLATDPVGVVGSTVRNTRIVLSGTTSGVLGGVFDAELDVDFFGNVNGGTSREARPRIRRAVGTLRWANAWLLFGQEAQLISPLDPSSLSMVGIPGFTGTGNLSRWMPQIRFGLETGGTLRLGLEAAAVAPSYNHLLSNPTSTPDRAELSRRPFVQARVLTRWGGQDVGGELGVGGHYGWFFDDTDTLIVSRTAAVSGRISLTRFLEIRGEAFLGEGLGMLGGGGIDQTLDPSGEPIKTMGGWAQLNLKPRAGVELGASYGLDNPDDDLDPVTGREKNVSWVTHVHWRIAPVVFGVEYRRLETTYSDGVFDLQTANHVNIALGFEF